MKRHLINQSRAGTHVATSPLARVAVALLLLLSNSLAALAASNENVSPSGTIFGPWTYESRRYGYYASNQQNYCSYNNLNGNNWFGEYQSYVSKYHSDVIIDFYTGFSGQSFEYTKTGCFSIFYRTEKVPSYTRREMTWNYDLELFTNAHWEHMALYVREDVEALKATNVDFTEGWWNKSGGEYLINLIHKNSLGEVWKENCTSAVSFDNRNSSTEQNKTLGLLVTLIVDNQGPPTTMIIQRGGSRADATDLQIIIPNTLLSTLMAALARWSSRALRIAAR